ncbi:MAG: acyl-CoA dehydrogenase family protein [Geminicoccaceae bacterium]|nr:acyl-CoA dehydrogenase family protein [Geminicoccaceae bacterium]MCX8100392.1 acyl-CoA dehydrogenase family protein [Geminicoccaceae bacterium]MDW8369486.1 acyl-CoA dehydrogenase family protein [Geminicoccaceae bacterium]
MPSEEQRLVAETARAFARERLAPHAAAFEKAGSIPREVLAELGRLGFLGMTVPPEWGGAGTDYVSYALALEAIAWGDGSVSTVMSVQNAPVNALLLRWGSEAQKRRWLVPLARGEIIGAFALTEPEAGSDAANLRTRARRTSRGWVLDGRKQFITSGSIARVCVVFAATDPAAGKRGISAFLVPTDRPGYKVLKVEEKLGQKASDTCALAFENLELEEDALLGSEGQGYRIALSALEAGRIGIAAQSVGMAQAALDHAIAYARERRAFGKPILDHQAVAFRLAEARARLEAARQLTLHAARLLDAGEPALEAACMAKLVASETAEAVCSAAIQTLGGYGYLEDFPVGRIWRDVRVCQIYEGTSDIQKLLIARGLGARL